MANGLVVDIPGAVERGLQFQQAAQLRPLQQQQAQLGLQQQRQALALGGLQQQAAQQGIESEQQKAKSQNLFNAVAIIRSLPDEQKLGAIQQNIAEIQARGGDASESIQAATLAREGRFGELNQGLDNLFQAGVSTGFLKAPAITAPTSLQRNLLAAGLQPGTQEFQQAVLTATTKPTTIIGAGEKAEEKELAKLRVGRFSDVQERATNASKLVEQLDQLDAIDVQTGALEPAKASLAAVVEGFGLDASGIANATTAQAFNAISERLVNDVLNAATGPQTDQDAARARKTIAGLGDTPEAAVFKNASLRAVALRQIEQRDFIENELERGNKLSEANKAWRKFKSQTPSLSSVVKNSTTGLPVFFYQFQQNARSSRPGITDDEIVKAWRSVHGN